MWQQWAIIGIVLFIAEILIPGFLLASFGLACFVSAIFAFFHFGYQIQILAFCVSAATFFLVLGPVYRRYFGQRPKVETGIRALIGKSAKVIEKIDNNVRQGRVEVGPETWKAFSAGGEIIEIGEIVTIEDIKNVTLYVRVNREN